MRKLSTLTGILGAAALLVSGCGGTTSQTATGAAELVPASAAVFVAVDTDQSSDQWERIDALARKFPDRQQAVDSFERQLTQDGLDWNDDVRPALGPELDLVLLDFEHPKSFVGLIQPRDDAAFARLAEKTAKHDPSNAVVYEKFRSWTVVGQTHDAINAFEQASDHATQMLADDATFRRATRKLDGGILRAYVNGAQAQAAIRKSFGPEAARYFARLGTLDWLTTTLRAKDDGIGWDTIVHGTPGAQLKHLQAAPSSGSLERFVPRNALAYLAFHGTKGMFNGVADNPILQQPGFARLGEVFAQLGRVLQGENAFYVRAGTGPYPEATLVASPGGGVDGAAALDRVFARFAADLGAAPTRRTVAGVPARVFRAGPVSLMYANVGGKLVVSDAPAALSFAGKGGPTVRDSNEYRRAASSSRLPRKPQAVLYVDIHSTIPAVEKLAHTKLPEGIRRNLTPLRSALEYAVGRSHELQVSFFLRIQ